MRVFELLEMFPDFRMRVKQDRKVHKVEMDADIRSVFDIAWYSFARMVSDVAPPADTDSYCVKPKVVGVSQRLCKPPY